MILQYRTLGLLDLPYDGSLNLVGRAVSPSRRRGGRTHLLLALVILTIDHASLSRRSTVPTPVRDTSNISALVTLLPYIT